MQVISTYPIFPKTIKLAVFNRGLSLLSGTVDSKSFLSYSERQPASTKKWAL